MKEIELIEKRKTREKHFLQEDGTIVAKIYNDDVHFLKNGIYEEIDNSLVEDEQYFYNKNNSYKAYFSKNSQTKLLKIQKDNHCLEFDINDKNGQTFKTKINTKGKIKYKNIKENMDFDYKLLSNKIKESIILNSNTNVPSKIEFKVVTDLDMIINDDGSISLNEKETEIFKIDKPYMIDDNNIISHNVNYKLNKGKNSYSLELILDFEWLNQQERKFPVIIDPTITNSTSGNSVSDTYITSGYPNTNYNSLDKLYVGASIYDGDTNPTINRALIRFELPTLSTGSEIVNARLNLIGFPIESMHLPVQKRLIEVHRVTSSWTESGATWNNMNNKYDNRVETCFYGGASYYDVNNEVIWESHFANITNLVKKWYIDNDNYGLMLMTSDESGVDDGTFLPRFFSNANIVVGDNPQPKLIITYRNHNGLEDYLEYFTQDFSVGKVSINSYNGNLVGLFNLASFKTGKIPAALNIVYNTNDVVSNYNVGYGLGWRLNLAQTITYITSDDILSYVDFDGTTHYFNNSKKVYNSNGYLETISSENVYYDEDGLDVTITSYTNKYELKDKNGSLLEFTKQNNNIAILTKISDIEGNYLSIEYSDGKISNITDSYGRQITLTYNSNNIIVASPDEQITVNYSNNKLSSIIYGSASLNNTTLYFDYNSQNIISGVQYDVYRRVNYEYYSKSPYKVKKVFDVDGQFFTLSYNNSSTTVTDSNGKVMTYTFNSYGNVVSISDLKSQDFVKSALGRAGIYGEAFQEKNKLISMEGLTGYINNLLTNTSFEETGNIFSNETGISSTIVNECSNSGQKSLKIVSTQANKNIYKVLSVTKGADYTFSAYVKNSTMAGIKLSLEYTNSSNEVISEAYQINNINSDFSRYDVSIHYPLTATSNLKLKIGAVSSATFYIDDIQLEEGNVANTYNYIDNSDFSNGTTGWKTSASQLQGNQIINVNNRFEVVTLADGSKALKIKMAPTISTGIYRSFNLSGTQGDNYTLSFWYKNKGITPDDNLTNNCCLINFTYPYGQCSIPSINLNPNPNEWQFFTYTFYAEHDYTSISVNIFQEYDANDLYITNFSLFKNIKKSKLSYDQEGNVLSVTSFDDSTTSFNYDSDNKLIQMFDKVGNNLSFEYDNYITNRVINGISDIGISNEVRYGEQNVPTLTRIVNKTIINIDDGTYRIRLYGTQKYLNFVNKMLQISDEDDIQTRWVFESIVVNNKTYYKIRHSIIENSYISNLSSTVGVDQYTINNSLLELIRNDNRSYYIKLYNTNKYITINNDSIVFSELSSSELSTKNQFYIEKSNDSKFIENTGLYNEDGLVIKNITNSNLNNINYDYDTDSGKLNEVINAEDISTYYYYESNTNNLLGVRVGERTIGYIYNDLGQLSTINYIVSGSILKSYFYSYDTKKRLSSVRVGNNYLSYPLYTNTYDNDTDNLILVEYPNNSSIAYEYDNMDRIYKITTDDNIYKHYYCKSGIIGKILSNNDVYKYIYDREDRIKKYIFNDFSANYLYDEQLDLLTNIEYDLNNLSYSVSYDFGTDNIIKYITSSNGIYEYIYDELGRICGQKINNFSYNDCNYIDNGNRATKLLQSVNNNGDIYSNKYDKKENVTHIYHNNILEKRYTYDELNQLIREDDYRNNITIRFKYDNSGNLISKKIFKLNTYELINSLNYSYQMTSNGDVLTSIGNESISYDSCFNPTSIGQSVTITWKNKNQLSSYADSNRNISVNYLYDKDGLRIKKEVNNVITNYYWSDNKLIIENNNGNILYFIYDPAGNLLGFEYNGARYTYVRNSMQEIVGIINDNNSYVAKYTYDSWGKVLSICDGNGNDVSQNNNHIANINPFLYKNYYFDKETNMYHLKNRYYNPSWCRFINPDSTINNDIFGTNPYIYCSNNPVRRKDSDGQFWGAIGIAITGALVGAAVNTISNLAQGKKWSDGIWGAAAAGAVGSLITVYSAGTSTLAAGIVTAATGSLVNELTSYVSVDVNVSSKKKKTTPVVSIKQTKEVNSKNLYDSFTNIATDVTISAISSPIVGTEPVKKFINKIAYFNSGWFEPKKFISGFASKYTIKKSLHELVEGSINESISVLLKPTELDDIQSSDIQSPIVETDCPPFVVNQCPVLK